jgi:hypothetical protein
MARVLRSGGLLAVTSRNWELIRDRGSHLDSATGSSCATVGQA